MLGGSRPRKVVGGFPELFRNCFSCAAKTIFGSIRACETSSSCHRAGVFRQRNSLLDLNSARANGFACFVCAGNIAACCFRRDHLCQWPGDSSTQQHGQICAGQSQRARYGHNQTAICRYARGHACHCSSAGWRHSGIDRPIGHGRSGRDNFVSISGR